ncbi:outer membrane protein assembly factor BamA [Marinilabiliaceae bacterium ANBcel2]|nr:outer membrane protein assembly factor BamA [Marinilabiliaceae bacterium ANBcel2]
MRHLYIYIILPLLLIFQIDNSFGQTDPEIRKISFKGNSTFSEKTLKNEISFSASRWLGQKILGKTPSYYTEDASAMNKRELIHFYQSEGYLNISIEKREIKEVKSGKKVELTYFINEGDPVLIDSVAFKSGVEDIDSSLAEELNRSRSSIEAVPGNRFRDDLIWNDRDVITRLAVEEGYAYAEINPIIKVDTTKKKATILWDIDAGPFSHFGEVTITGNNRTAEHHIRQQIAFNKGDVYSREKLSISQQQVHQLGVFRVASLRAQLTREKRDTIPVKVSITEAPQTSTRLGAGYGREDKIRTFIDYQILNFPYGVQRVNLYAKHSALEPYRFEAKITQPAVFSPNSTITLSPFIRRQKEAGYNLMLYGSELSLLQKLTSTISSSVNIFYETVRLDTATVAIVETPEFSDRKYSKKGISVGAQFDNSKPRFNPSYGWMIALNAKSNSNILSGTFPFLKYQVEIKNYREILRDRIILALKFKGGAVQTTKGNSFVPVEERFYAGGGRSVRGWARHQLGPMDENKIPLGGKGAIELSIEPRIRITRIVSAALFYDAGNIWENTTDISISDLRSSAGAGLRFQTPIGPAGIDVSRPVWDDDKSWQLHFNIGHAF